MAYSRIAALIGVCSLLGCIQEIDKDGGPGWVKRDATYATLQKDLDECERAARLPPVRYAGPASVPAERRRRFTDCLTDRGWTYEPHVSNDGMKQIVDCKLPSVEQVQRLSAGDCHNRFGKILS